MPHFDHQTNSFVGPAGSLTVSKDDEHIQRLAMLMEGECDTGANAAAEKFGLSRARYFQLRQQFEEGGCNALLRKKSGPKRNYRRTDEIVRQVIRHRFLDLDASAEVITQKLVQSGVKISVRSVQRIIQDYALQKKTLPTSSAVASH